MTGERRNCDLVKGATGMRTTTMLAGMLLLPCLVGCPPPVNPWWKYYTARSTTQYPPAEPSRIRIEQVEFDFLNKQQDVEGCETIGVSRFRREEPSTVHDGSPGTGLRPQAASVGANYARWAARAVGVKARHYTYSRYSGESTIWTRYEYLGVYHRDPGIDNEGNLILHLSPAPRASPISIGRDSTPVTAGTRIALVPLSPAHDRNTARISEKQYFDWIGDDSKPEETDIALVGHYYYDNGQRWDDSRHLTALVRDLLASGNIQVIPPEDVEKWFEENSVSAVDVRARAPLLADFAAAHDARYVITGDVDLCRWWRIGRFKRGGYCFEKLHEIGISLYLHDGESGRLLRSVHHRLSSDQMISEALTILQKDVAAGKPTPGMPEFAAVRDAVVQESVNTLLNPVSHKVHSTASAIRWNAAPPENVDWEKTTITKDFFQQLHGQIILGSEYPGRPVLVEIEGEMVEVGTAPICIPVDVQFHWGKFFFRDTNHVYFAKVCGKGAAAPGLSVRDAVEVVPGIFLALLDTKTDALAYETPEGVYAPTLVISAFVRKDFQLVPLQGAVHAPQFLEARQVYVD